MSAMCGCGSETRYVFELGCVECGTACCPRCAVPLESVSYCARCAGDLLGATSVRANGPFDLC